MWRGEGMGWLWRLCVEWGAVTGLVIVAVTELNQRALHQGGRVVSHTREALLCSALRTRCRPVAAVVAGGVHSKGGLPASAPKGRRGVP